MKNIKAKLEDVVDNLFEAYLWVMYSVLPSPDVSPEDKARLQLELLELKNSYPKNKFKIITSKGKEMYAIVVRKTEFGEACVYLYKDDPKSEDFIDELKREGIIEG